MMWVMKDGSGAQTWTAHEDIAETLRVHHGYEVTPVVPASEVREKDELIQKLADTIADDPGPTFMEMSFGLRIVGGKWERCK